MGEGKKFDAGKLRYDLLDPIFQEGIVKVLTQGAEEYGDTNYKDVEAHRYIAAILRHFNSYRQGEMIDPDSGESHLSHIGANLMFLDVNARDSKKEEKKKRSKITEKFPNTIPNHRYAVYEMLFLIDSQLTMKLYGMQTLQPYRYKEPFKGTEGSMQEISKEELIENGNAYLQPSNQRFIPESRLKQEYKDQKEKGSSNKELTYLLERGLDKKDTGVQIIRSKIIYVTEGRGKSEGKEEAERVESN